MKLKKYEVSVPVEGYEYFLVEATNKKQAIDDVMNGLVGMHDSDIHQSFDRNDYQVEEVE